MVVGGQRHAPAALPPGKRPGVQPVPIRHADLNYPGRRSRSSHYVPKQNGDDNGIFI